jgi:DNA-binding transcriptional regulator WhiA
MNNEEENNAYQYFVSAIVRLNPTLKVGNNIITSETPLKTCEDFEKVLEKLENIYNSKEVAIINIQRFPI